MYGPNKDDPQFFAKIFLRATDHTDEYKQLIHHHWKNSLENITTDEDKVLKLHLLIKEIFINQMKIFLNQEDILEILLTLSLSRQSSFNKL